jgi:predicted transposase YdaD
VPKPFDAATKHLFETDPGTWMAYAELVPDGPLRVLDTDISTVSSAADAVVRVDGVAPWLVHFEFQASHDATLPKRLLRYNVLLADRHELPVLTVIILLRPEAARPDLTGVFQQHLPSGRLCHEFHYLVIRAWEKPIEDVLSGGVATLPLASLADVPRETMPEIARRVNERLRLEVRPAEAETLWTAFFILLGLRYPPEFINRLREEVTAMLDLRESSFYQTILEEGREEGRQQGLQEGRQQGATEGAIRSLMRVGQDRFGPCDPEIAAKINAITEPDRVIELTARALRVSSWEELFSRRSGEDSAASAGGDDSR